MRPTGWRRWRDALLLQEDLNFLLTNRVPRIALSRAMGRLAAIESPLLARACIALWRLFTELDLSEARETRFTSLRACFTRALREGARPLDADPAVLVSPCDGIVGACGRVEQGLVVQAKGMPYTLADLFAGALDESPWRDGCWVTLRLTSAMVHRFHAPADALLEHVVHIAGDTWNVNPIALARVQRLFCRNERALLRLRLPAGAPGTPGGGEPLLIVPVAAILVAGLRLHAPPLHLHTAYAGPDHIPCAVPLAKGQEMGWFEHGSTILVFAPPGFALAEGVRPGERLRMGQALLRRLTCG